MRRLLGALAVLIIAAGAIVAVAPAHAQDSAVTLRLLRQSPWSTREHRPELELTVLASNTGPEPLDNLSVAVSFGPHYVTRSDYEQSLTVVPSTEGGSTVSRPLHGDLPPGSARDINMTIDLSEVAGIDQSDSQTYPAVVTVASNGIPAATLMTPVIYIVQEPGSPLLSTTWVELSGPIAFDPSGTFVDPAFEAAIAPTGTLGAPVAAIADALRGPRTNKALDVVVAPMVVAQARDLADGYRLPDGTDIAGDDLRALSALGFVRSLSNVVADGDAVETVAQPYASPLLPAMLSSGLTTELAAQQTAGVTVVSSLGATPSSTVSRPPGGQLSGDVLTWLAAAAAPGNAVVLANADTVERDTNVAPARPPTMPLTTTAGSQVTAVLPDAGTQALFARPDLLGDPVRAAQAVLGELAVIWKERPSPDAPEVRGVAIAPPATLPPLMWQPLLSRLTAAPFLEPVKASELTARVNPSDTEAPLRAPSLSVFDPTYADGIDRLGHSIENYSSMLTVPSDVTTDLRRDLFIATAPAFVVDPAAGQQWLAPVSETTDHAFGVVTPSVSREITFTSREGTIPLVMGDPGNTPLRVTVQLQSLKFSFPDGDSQDVTVERPGQVVEFQVVANTAGQNPIRVKVRAPNGRTVAPDITVVVHSTAVNHIALLVTLGAGVALLALYSRRWFRRRRTPA